jgi:PAS domain S-box-containing protein
MNGQKILIADDEPLNLMLYAEMLKSKGYEIVAANDGLEAVMIAFSEKPDLIVLDWNMPRMDGLEALKKIKSDASFKNTPIIIITGIMTSSENLKNALDSGAIDFLRKPFDKLEFHARVNSGLLLAQTINDLKEKIDIIERKNLFINTLMNSIPHPMVYYNLNGFIEGCNQHFKELFDNDYEDFKGINIHNIMYDKEGESHSMIDRRMIKASEGTSYESVAGSLKRDFFISKTIYNNSVDKPEGIMCVMTDITDLKKANNEILNSKTRELTSTALRMAHLAELNNKIIADLENLHQHTDNAGSELIRKIINSFGISSSKNMWHEFESRFEEVYEAFYNKMTKQFPDLTQGERKLCALLRLNMTSKDIAALTFQNPQSVDVARYRLRKKLNLEPDVNLNDFLMAIE